MSVSNEDEVLFAEPNSTDLCCDLEGMTVESVITFDDEIMIKLIGGSGLLSVDGVPCQWEAITELELTGGFLDHPENVKVVTMMTDVLEEWRSKGTKLRLLSAPEKITTLVEDSENWLPIPCGTVGT